MILFQFIPCIITSYCWALLNLLPKKSEFHFIYVETSYFAETTNILNIQNTMNGYYFFSFCKSIVINSCTSSKKGWTKKYVNNSLVTAWNSLKIAFYYTFNIASFLHLIYLHYSTTEQHRSIWSYFSRLINIIHETYLSCTCYNIFLCHEWSNGVISISCIFLFLFRFIFFRNVLLCCVSFCVMFIHVMFPFFRLVSFGFVLFCLVWFDL